MGLLYFNNSRSFARLIAGELSLLPKYKLAFTVYILATPPLMLFQSWSYNTLGLKSLWLKAYVEQELFFIWSEALLPSGPVSQMRICWALKAWKWQTRQSCLLGSKRSPSRKAWLRWRWTDWSDTPSRSTEFLRDLGREWDLSTRKGVWRCTGARASGRDETASGNYRESAGGLRKGRLQELSQPRRPGESSRAAAGAMERGRAGSPWQPHGSSCRCRRPDRRGEAKSWPDAAVCLSSCGSETTPVKETQRIKY